MHGISPCGNVGASIPQTLFLVPSVFSLWCCNNLNKVFGGYFALCSLQGSESVSHSVVWPFVTHAHVAHQAPLSIRFPRQECWSGSSCPSPGDLPDPGIKPWSPALQADSLPPEAGKFSICIAFYRWLSKYNSLFSSLLARALPILPIFWGPQTLVAWSKTIALTDYDAVSPWAHFCLFSELSPVCYSGFSPDSITQGLASSETCTTE